MILDLIQNASLLITLTVFYSLLTRFGNQNSIIYKILGGILFGTIALAAMKMSVHYDKGIIYDGRSIVLTLAGLFGGGIPAVISTMIAGIYRFYIGGAGVWAGTATIVASASVGLLFRIYHDHKPESLSISRLFFMGLLTHILMLFCQLLLPMPSGIETIQKIWGPVLLVFPLATLLMGLLLATDQKRSIVEKELKKSESLYRITLHSIGDAVITTDCLGKVRFMNAQAEHLTGWTENDAIGQSIDSIFLIFSEDSGLKMECPVQRILKEGKVIGLANHTTLLSKDGRKTPIADSGAPIKDEQGNISGVVLVFRDQTEERTILYQLHENKERFKRAVENIPDAVFIYDQDLKIQFVNDKVETIIQALNSTVIGLSDAEIWPVDFYEAYFPVLKKTFVANKINQINLSLDNSKTGRKFLNITCIPLTDEYDNVVEVMSIMNDYTKSKLIEDELLERERLYHNLTNNSPVGIFRTSPDGQTTYVNPQWCKLSDLSYEAALGYGWYNAIMPDDIEYLQNEWNKTIQNQTKSVTEYRFKKKDGSVVWVLGVAVPEFSIHGELIGYIGTITDISDRKKAEEDLRQSEDNFRRSIDESPLGIRIVSENGHTLYINQALFHFFGFENSNDFDFKKIEERYSQKSLTEHVERREKRKSGKFVNPEYDITIFRPNNEIRHLHVLRKTIIWDGKLQFLVIYQDITERKRVEEALIQSEESLKEAQEIAQMGDWKYDTINNVHIWSENCYRLFGLEPYEITPTYEYFRSRIHPDDLILLDKNRSKILTCRKPVEMKIRLIMPNGQIRWILNKIIPEFEQDNLIRLRGINIDITELTITLEALQKSEKSYKNLFKNHSAIKLIINPETGIIIDANSAAENFYGYSKKELQKMNFKEILVLEETDFFKELSDIKNSQKKQAEYFHRISDGTIRNVEVFTSLIDFQDNKYLHSIVYDITEKKKAEKLLQLLSRSTNQSPVSIVITDPNGIIEYVNPKFTETSGYNYSEVIGKNPNFLKSGIHSRDFYQNLWKTIKTGKEWHGEFLNKRKNGELYWENAVISSIVDKDGVITHFVENKEDITEKKKIYEDLKIAKEKAEESDRLKSAFLANMSHEIRTPLNAILGFTNELTQEPDIDLITKKEYSKIINRNAENLLQIINDILDISKLETGQLKISKNRFNLNQILKELLTEYKKKLINLNKENIDIELNNVDQNCTIYTDMVRLVQIITNLLNNSLKFTHEGKIVFGVSQISNTTITFFVTDTGIGIEKNMQYTIFERFRQVNDSTTRIYGGTGLGLSIVKNLVQLLGGDIILNSEIGKGSTFEFWIAVD